MSYIKLKVIEILLTLQIIPFDRDIREKVYYAEKNIIKIKAIHQEIINNLDRKITLNDLALKYNMSLTILKVSNYFQYNSTFYSTYKESGVRRISLAETLRKLPLSFFAKKDLSDLTTIILNDASTLEHNFSHVMPQFIGSIISTCLIAISLFFFEWRMAIAALWVLPISLAIVGCSSKVQDIFNKKKNQAVLEFTDGIQECIETVKELKANNAEDEYLKGLNKKIKKVEKKNIFAELGVAIFVMTATMLLKFGMATVALTGSYLLINNSLSVITFFMFLLVVSRLYEPMGGSLINLAAIISQNVNIERKNELNEYPIQEGSKNMNNKGYDIEFKNVEFSYDKKEKVLNDVSFVAKQGEVTALIGPSGGGKTTTSKLCARFWDATRGKILLGGNRHFKNRSRNIIRELFNRVPRCYIV